jgi:hypothetical protein
VLFVHENEVWELANEDTDDEVEQPYNGPWPVQSWFTSCDFDDGNGWRRPAFEKHGKVLEHFLHDVGSGDSTEAVLVEVATAADLVALVVEHRFELCDKQPARL